MQAIKPLIVSPTKLGASREIQCFLQIRTFGDGQGIPKRVQKSGSFLCSDQYCSRYLVGSRGKGAPDSGGSNTGFRCVR
jgi:formylglycine-generating enzyme required for sulfatase activity